MLSILVLLVVCAPFSHGRPSSGQSVPRPVSFQDVDSFIVGGENALPGAWPWQLSMERLSISWSHTCGASLLSGRYALTAAHCQDTTAVSGLRIVAGLHDRRVSTGTQTRTLSSYKKHEQYSSSSLANDIAILTYSPAIVPTDTIAYATLPLNNNDDFAGQTCVITGWGRDSGGNTLPNILQQGDMSVLTYAQCRQELQAYGNILSSHICIKHPRSTIVACNGDSGGPLNCQSGPRYVVSGIASFVIQSQSLQCLPSYPQGYTRVSSFLSWITTNTP